MGDLTENLSRKEFACNCGCGFDTVDTELIPALQHGVDFFENKYSCDVWIEITGPNRCYESNLKLVLKGIAAVNSQHVFGRAVDFKLFKVVLRNGKRAKGEQINPAEVYAFYNDNYHEFGIGEYSNRLHLDSRSNGPARWRVK